MATVGVIAGGGRLPELIVANILSAGHDVCLVTFKGQAAPDVDVEAHEVALGQVGKVEKILKEHHCLEIVFAGYLSKPSLFDIRVDLTGARILKKVISKNDNVLLSAICDYFSNKGFNVKGAHEICPELVALEGFLTKKTTSQLTDGTLGVQVSKILGKADVGQSVIVKDGVVIGVEAVEGTAALIERCASLRGKADKGGILTKMSKPGQDLRIDMPTVGPETIKALVKNRYEGLVIEAGKTLILDAPETVALADKNGVFIYVTKGE